MLHAKWSTPVEVDPAGPEFFGEAVALCPLTPPKVAEYSFMGFDGQSPRPREQTFAPHRRRYVQCRTFNACLDEGGLAVVNFLRGHAGSICGKVFGDRHHLGQSGPEHT